VQFIDADAMACQSARYLSNDAWVVRAGQIEMHSSTVRPRGRAVTAGFEYAGANYPSLTKIAKKITGAHWSGPRFFRLLAAGAEHPSNGGRDG